MRISGSRSSGGFAPFVLAESANAAGPVGRAYAASDGVHLRGEMSALEPDGMRSKSASARNGDAGISLHHVDIARRQEWRGSMLKVLGWIFGIIFLIGLAVVVGVFDLIF
jgi:hypothetical protein